MVLYINLLNFNSDKLGGVGFFIKRIFESIHKYNVPFFEKFDEVVIFTSSNINANETFCVPNYSNIRIVKIKYISKFILVRIFYEQFILPMRINKSSAIFYTPSPIFPLFISLIMRNVQVFVTIHDLIPFYFKHKYGYFRSQYIKILTFLSAKLSDKIITVSESTKNDITNIFGIHSSKINIIYNFLNDEVAFYPYAVKNQIVSISTIEPGKNYVNMILGFLHFINSSSKFKNYKYIIIGKKGWNFSEVFNVINNNDLKDNILFMGYVNDSEKYRVLAEAQCLLFLSKYEGFGVPILESLYCNTPAIVLNNSSLPEVLGKSGIIINEDDPVSISNALTRIIDNRNYYCSFINDDLKKFDPISQIDKFCNLF